MSTTGLTGVSSSTGRLIVRLSYIDPDGDTVTPLYPNGDEWYRPVIWVKNVYILHWNKRWVEDEKKFAQQVYEHTMTYLSSLHIYEVEQPIIIAVNPYRPTIKEIQVSRRRVVYNTWGMQQESLERAICMSGDDERQTCITTNPGSILQVRRIWPL